MGWPACLTGYRLLTDWGGLIAGVLGFAAAIIAVLLTLLSERRRATRELNSLRRALGVEIRLYTINAHTAYLYLKSLLFDTNGERVMATLVEDRAKLPSPAIYPNAALKIGEFGGCAAELVRFFASIAAVREAAERLLHHPQADNLPSSEIAKTADGLMKIAMIGIRLFPFFKTGVKSDDDADNDAVSNVECDARIWSACRTEFYPFRS